MTTANVSLKRNDQSSISYLNDAGVLSEVESQLLSNVSSLQSINRAIKEITPEDPDDAPDGQLKNPNKSDPLTEEEQRKLDRLSARQSELEAALRDAGYDGDFVSGDVNFFGDIA